ncbi:MAG TPA: metallophosphoesterase family protein [Vicinamibacteria bacterium]|nr:metallophosphoesterase family protein [Vicinamibacteria bacterium]
MSLRTIAHISDLHFGREDPPVVEALLADLAARGPSLVAVSGDLTQRARAGQFRAAREFLDRLPAPTVVVPGNHDIPLFDVLRRAVRPIARYRAHITDDLAPFWRDDVIAVLGVNTARPSLWKDGRISHAQIALMRERFCSVPEGVLKVLVTHHPFVPAPADPAPATVGRGREALLAAEECGVDLLLAGHLHKGFLGDVGAHYVAVRRSILVAQAGTAVSLRTRDEPNTYNWIVVEPPGSLHFEVRAFGTGGFRTLESARYARVDGRWRRE